MSAMTWWDHSTESSWSQPWGTAIDGPLKGTALTLIPASIVPWSTWLAEHPDTTVLATDGIDSRLPFQPARDDFVIGVSLGESATAYRYELASDLRVINDRIGQHPIAVFVDPESRDIKVYLRRPATAAAGPAAPSELQFEIGSRGAVVDTATGTLWDTTTGVAVEGPLKGAVLQQIPYVTSFDWAWEDFFPHSTFYALP